MKRKLWGVLGIATLAVSLGATSAYADDSPAAGVLTAVNADEYTTTGTDALCEEARRLDNAAGACEAQLTLSATSGDTADVAKISPEDLALVAADGTTLQDAIGTQATVWTRTWEQSMRGLYYVNWMEKHTGRIYWDGSRVWSTNKTAGYTGTHVCDQGFGILYDIDVKTCSTENIGAAQLREWDYFRVHVVWKGVPLYASHNMHMTANNKGTVS